jgi:FeS assembly protein IscX
MKWTDIHEVAVELAEAHPEVDPLPSTSST